MNELITYPRWLHHPTEPSQIFHDPVAGNAALETGWSTKNFPKPEEVKQDGVPMTVAEARVQLFDANKKYLELKAKAEWQLDQQAKELAAAKEKMSRDYYGRMELSQELQSVQAEAFEFQKTVQRLEATVSEQQQTIVKQQALIETMGNEAPAEAPTETAQPSPRGKAKKAE